MDADVREADVVLNNARSDVEAPLPRMRRFDPRTRLLLSKGPSWGHCCDSRRRNVLVMFAQAAVGLIETYFIAKLGIDALAGVTLVFPVLMLMQMMSAGAMGGRDLVRDRPRARRRSSSETVPSSGIGGSDFSQASNRALS